MLNSQQMKKVEVAIEVGATTHPPGKLSHLVTTWVEVAIEVDTITHPGTIGSPGKNLLNKVDSAATKELATEVEAVRNDNRVQKVYHN